MTDLLISGNLFINQAVNLPELKLRTTYDFALGALSWEQRSIAALKAIKDLTANVYLLRFASSDVEKLQKKDEQSKLFREKFDNLSVLHLKRSTEYSHNTPVIEQFLADKAVAARRPLRLLIDTTCMPKSYLLYLLAISFSRGYTSRIDFIYAEGEYSLDVSHSLLTEDNAERKGIISEGEWISQQVPFLEADLFPSKRDLIVTMGGEVGLSVPFIERYEPRRLHLILISESLVQHPDKLPDSERHALTSILSEPNVQRSDVSLTDVKGVIASVNSFLSSSRSDVTTGVAIGSKPHALALGISALSQSTMEVVCRIPKRYIPLDVRSSGRFSVYEVEDRFEPTTYYHGK
ncbi:hypothetical protein [Lichenibacterium dinghuense]|uniref:hypothetical protein n=1 Tax=Lichenibacterium dinghuense TaxID=2895977 RepID=UPI001F2F293A|nr:hypothetical protein [Lichenibacterium sp. 6Y81]